MKRSSLFIAGYLSLVCSLSATSSWSPQYEDLKVEPRLAEQLNQSLPQEPIVVPSVERKILVFSATAGFRHKSIPLGKMALVEMGTHSGAYTALVSDDLANFEPEVLMTFDAVVLLSPTGNFFMPNKNEREQFETAEWAWLEARHKRLIGHLVTYVQEGGGLMGIHAATDVCYHDEAYGETIGAYFAGHPWNSRSPVTIVVVDPHHATIQPVFGDIREFSFEEEIYQFAEEPYSREKLRILLRLDPERSHASAKSTIKRTDGDFPVAWVQQVGEGCVFYTSLGHNKHSYTNPLMLRHFLAGIQFATGDLHADTSPSLFAE